jgi:hypothetical protein
VTGETLPARIAVIRDSGIPCLFKPVRPEQLLGALAQQARLTCPASSPPCAANCLPT